MPGSSPWPIIHAERGALADDLERLSDGQWEHPSLCVGWSVHDVLGHLLATAKTTPTSFLVHFARAGFTFPRMAESDLRAQTAGGPSHTLADFRSHQGDTTSPPGPIDAMLGDTLVHAEDIRRPLGIVHEYPMAAMMRAAEFYVRSNLLIGTKRRVAGVRLRATDTPWTHGSGPEVSGPMMPLLLAMTGRSAALADLDGEGLQLFSTRFV
jgi:uncharacterized protein (TIGR03083 family)